ncbi:unnamed protein product [Staurois parvus]|uniref:ribonuclease Z n=1 Tax=Staurois parvus TaxID=386267 RepID=A0ABN9CEP1_9NEOB|nr:unnamed protein product [Staurois parvus]
MQSKKHTVSQAIGVGERMNAEYVMLNHFSQRYSRLPLMRNDLSRKVGISFDHMRVRWSDFQILPKLMEPIKALFAEDLIEMVQKKERRERIQKAQNLDDNLKPDPSKQDQEDDTIGPDPSKRHVEDDTGDAITKRMKVK